VSVGWTAPFHSREAAGSCPRRPPGPEPLLAASHDRAWSFIPVPREGEHLTQEPNAQQRLHDVTDLFEGYIEAGEHMLTQPSQRTIPINPTTTGRI